LTSAQPAGNRPSEGEIIAMIRTVHAEGARGRKIAKAVRAKPGFANVKHGCINDLSKGLFTRVGRGGSKE
jgi:hypothetical protein